MSDDGRDIHVRMGPGEVRARGPRRRQRAEDRAARAELREERRSRREARRERRLAQELTPEERAYHEARKVANAKFGFMVHLVLFGSVCLFLLAIAGLRVAMIVALSWGMGLALHYFVGVVAPGLRRRWIQEEVGRQVSTTTSRQRQELTGAHARNLEELSASIAHEIRNPITAAKSLVQQMGEDPAAHENVEYAQVALEELDRVERSISHLLRYAREQDVHAESMRMVDVIDSALDSFRDRFHALGVAVRRQLDTDGQMVGDPEKLRRVVINLLGNALDALEESHTPQPWIEVSGGDNLAGSEVWVRIRDNGPGIDPERLARIFSPFYTSKAKGTGLGLAISKKVVDAHGGSIQVESRPGSGTEFVLVLPKTHDEGGSR